MQDLTNDVRNEPSKNGESVKLPNDPEIEYEKIRLKEGIPLDEDFCDSVNKLLEQFNLKNDYF